MTDINELILIEPISKLSISDDLKCILIEKGVTNLWDVLAKEFSLTRREIGISFEQELELFQLLERNGVECYWKEK